MIWKIGGQKEALRRGLVMTNVKDAASQDEINVWFGSELKEYKIRVINPKALSASHNNEINSSSSPPPPPSHHQ